MSAAAYLNSSCAGNVEVDQERIVQTAHDMDGGRSRIITTAMTWRNWPKCLLSLAILGLVTQSARLLWLRGTFDIREWTRVDYFFANLIAVLIMISVRFWPT
jgi:hypothetical protein